MFRGKIFKNQEQACTIENTLRNTAALILTWADTLPKFEIINKTIYFIQTFGPHAGRAVGTWWKKDGN